MRTKLLLLAIAALSIQLLTACQTRSDPSPSEIFEAVKPLNDTRAALLIEFCRGQKPQQITTAEYDSWPDAAKQYVTNNASQWLSAGCSA